MRGKGVFCWVPRNVAPSVEQLADTLLALGMARVDVKVAEGPWQYVPPDGKPNIDKAWVDYMHSRGIAVWGYGFCYGNNAGGEGEVLARQVNTLGLDGGIFDVEGTFDAQAWAPAKARSMAGAYKGATDKPGYLCTWSLFKSPFGTHPQWHSPAVAEAAMEFLDGACPMAYFWAGYPTLWANETFAQWRDIIDKPIVPVGRAYGGEGFGALKPAEQKILGERFRELGQDGESWWRLGTILANAGLRDVIANLPGYGPPEPPEPPSPPPDDCADRIRAWYLQLRELLDNPPVDMS